jgi:hypothetical protein
MLSILQRPPALDEINNQHHDGDDEQYMNEAAERVRADEAEQPENKKYDEDGPEHREVPFSYGSFLFRMRRADCAYPSSKIFRKLFSRCIKTRQSLVDLLNDCA